MFSTVKICIIMACRSLFWLEGVLFVFFAFFLLNGVLHFEGYLSLCSLFSPFARCSILTEHAFFLFFLINDP